MPPQSFRQVGFTVAGLFPDWLGSEAQMFVRYHVRRGWATLVVHSVLLGSYLAVMGWVFRPYIEAGPAVLLRGADGGGGGNTGEGGGGRGSAAAAAAVVVFWLASVAAVAMACVAVAWRRNEFQGHPLVKELDLYPGGWQESAMQIDIDHARMDKIVVCRVAAGCPPSSSSPSPPSSSPSPNPHPLPLPFGAGLPGPPGPPG